ncbi:MAG TPA: hypothetical protein VHE78_18215 [Gemmatimonadaceae bacterium]|nr:hypothetical protein [Gemmatimonadaceae bacterium]
MTSPDMPDAVYVIWWAGLIVTLVVFVPLSVWLLHRTWIAARSIRRYADEALVAAAGIAGNTQHIPALDSTITVGSAMVGVAGKIAAKLDTAATVLAQRAD